MSEEGNTVDPSNVLAKRRQILEVTVGLGAASIAGVSSVRGQQPVKIQDWNDLNAVRDDLGGKYILDTDLDETTKGYDEHVGNPPEGWNPIKELTGRFNGNNHKITGLKIDRPETSVVGLFKSVNTGKITDLALTGLSVTGDEVVGGLAGIINGEVKNSLVSGEVTGQLYVGGLAGANGSEKVEGGKITGSSASSNITANGFAGGLVGVNWGGEIVESSASSDVTGDETVGGLAGSNIEEGRVSRSSASGTVTGETSVGGLIGVNSGGTVTESSATGEVSGKDAVGGLIGNNFEQPNGFIGKIRDSFASGDVTGEDFVGGLVGINNGGEVSRTWACGVVTGTGSVGGLLGGNSSKLRAAYWDKNTTGQAEGIGQDRGDITGVVGLSTEEMTGDAAQENMKGLDFEETWRVTDQYPILGLQHSHPQINLDQLTADDIDIKFTNQFVTENTDSFLGSLWSDLRRAMPMGDPTLPDKNEAYIHVDLRVEFADEFAGSIAAVRPRFTHDQTDAVFNPNNLAHLTEATGVDYSGREPTLGEFGSGVYGWNDLRMRTPTQVGISLFEASLLTLGVALPEGEVSSPIEANTETYPDVFLTELEVENTDGETVIIDVDERVPRYDDACTSVELTGLANRNCPISDERAFGSGAVVFSPATIAVEDDQGRITGRLRENGEFNTYDEIPGALYSGTLRHEFVLAPKGDYQFIVDGITDGEATVVIDRIGDESIETNTYENIKVEESIRIRSTMGENTLTVDETRDGASDYELSPSLSRKQSPESFFQSRLNTVGEVPSNPADDVLFGFSETELAAGSFASIAMIYGVARMLSDDDNTHSENNR